MFSYQELYMRNFPIIDTQTQDRIAKLRVGIAGCGSTGGAAIDGLLRLGVQKFHLADNGKFELNNLNRQMVFAEALGRPKASVHAERVLNVNPEATVVAWGEGLTEENTDAFLHEIDFLFDAVDVTTAGGMNAKLHLHRRAHAKKNPDGVGPGPGIYPMAAKL